MAPDSTQPRVPLEGDDFRALVETQVGGPLGQTIAQVGLRRDRLIDEAVAAEDEILATVRAEQEALESRLQHNLAEGRRLSGLLGGGVSLTLAVAFAALRFLGVFGGWAEWATGVFIVLAAALPVLGALSARLTAPKNPVPAATTSSAGRLATPDQLTMAEGIYLEAVERAAQRWLSERANRALGLIYSATLPDIDPHGLAEIDDDEQEIPTKAREELESLIEHMPGGSIGLSGPRGAGKTTLLNRVTTRAWADRPDRIRVAVVVDAPVEYDARDFVLHLFAQLCEAVLGPDRVEAMRRGSGGFDYLPPRLWFLRPLAAIPPYLGPLLIAIGLTAFLLLQDAQGKLEPRELEPWAILAMAIGGVLSYATLLTKAPQVVRALPNLRSRVRPVRESLDRKAERHLRQIWFQRTFSGGWSGSFKVPVGVQVGVERSTQLAENQLSFPDVVTLYKSFARELAREGEVRLGIDELDKMEDRQAQRFLNEIKVIFRVSGCFYFVSVSEDAMAYFERRGLPFRDVFDSSFDHVMRIGYLTYADSKDLLRRRVVGMPAQFLSLAHVIGGGLARDVIRAARDISEEPTGTSIAAVAETIGAEHLISKCAAARVGARRLADPAQAIALSRWLGRLECAAAETADLLELCRTFDDDILAVLGPPPEDDREALEQHREALSIGLEVVAYAYFTLTLMEFMARLDTDEATRTAIHNESVDRLAKARQAFAMNPAEAWEAVSSVRTGRGEVLDFPALDELAAAP